MRKVANCAAIDLISPFSKLLHNQPQNTKLLESPPKIFVLAVTILQNSYK